MDIFGIIYKALNKLNKLVTSLRGAVDKKQNKLTYANGSEVTNYKDLKLNMLKGLPFRDTVLIVDSTYTPGHAVSISTDGYHYQVVTVYDIDYVISIKDPIVLLYDKYNGIGTLPSHTSACLSLKTDKSQVDHFCDFYNLIYCGYIDTMDSSTVSLNLCFSNCMNLNYTPDYFVQVPVISMVSTFRHCKSLTKLPMLDTSLSENFSQCCYECGMYELPDWDFSKGVNFSNFCFAAHNLISVNLILPEAANIEDGFLACEKLTTCNINAPKATDCNNIFHSSGIKTVNISTGKPCKMMQAFYSCSNLETVLLDGEFSALDYAFYECSSLKELPVIQVSKDDLSPTSITRAFEYTALTKFPILNGYIEFIEDTSLERINCETVQEIPKYTVCGVKASRGLFFNTPNLTTLGGFAGITDSLNFEKCPLLTRESVLNVFNNLAQSNATINLHKNTYTKLSEDDIAIAVSCGWAVEKSAY